MDDALEFFIEEVEELEKHCFNEWDYFETIDQAGTTENGIYSLKSITYSMTEAEKEGEKAQEAADLKDQLQLQIDSINPTLEMLQDMDGSGDLIVRINKCVAHLQDMISQIEAM